MNSRRLKIACLMCNWVFCDEEESVLNKEKQVHSDVSIVRLMCIGRLDLVVVLEAFENGIDGILLIGCAPPDCHFVEGNLYAEHAAKLLRKLLVLTGLEPERLELRWSSPLEEVELTDILADFTGKIQRLGVSPLANEKPDEEVLLNIQAARNAASNFRLRVLTGKEKELTEKKNVFGEKIQQEAFDGLIAETVESEFIRQKIRLLTTQKPLSVKQLAVIVKMKPAAILGHIVEMRRKGMVTLDHVEETTPFYKALGVK